MWNWMKLPYLVINSQLWEIVTVTVGEMVVRCCDVVSHIFRCKVTNAIDSHAK